MIRGLAIETSGRIGSVALTQDGIVLADQTFEHGLRHAARIIPAIDELCRAAQWKPGNIAEIYVSAGPGSFTGLRIGITLAKTLAFATGAKIVAVPSVRVLAENATPDAQNIIIVLDAKRDQIFTASFVRISPSPSTLGESRGESPHEIIPAHLGTLTDMLTRTPRPVHLLGEGIPYHEKFISPTDPTIIKTGSSCWRATPQAVAKIGWNMARANQFTDALTLIPLYIRRPEAEEKLAGKSKL